MINAGIFRRASRFGDDKTVYFCQETNLEFVEVSGGQFCMGDVWGDGEGDEKPIHWVDVSSFQLARTVITQAMWCRVMGDNPAETCGEDFVGNDKPVVNISWEDAQEFIDRLNALVPKGGYRLPSEAEWEYAARSCGKFHKWPGTNSKKALMRFAWCWDNTERYLPICKEIWFDFEEKNFFAKILSGLMDICIFRPKLYLLDSFVRLRYKFMILVNDGLALHDVAQKKPNELGLYDMAGNVWEWCQDRWHDNYEGAPSDSQAWVSGEIDCRVMRGGSWKFNTYMLRSTSRIPDSPSVRDCTRGLRLARDNID